MNIAVSAAEGLHSLIAIKKVELLDVERHDDLLRAKDIDIRWEHRHVEVAVRVPPPRSGAELRQAPRPPISADPSRRQTTILDEHEGLLPGGGDAKIDFLCSDSVNVAQEGPR